MAAELVNLATSEKLKEMDWIKNIEICELVARDEGEARDVIRTIKRRLGDKSSNTQLFTVMLLEVLINNCGQHIHRHVIDMGLLPILVKIVKKKSDLPVGEKIFLLLDATQASLGGASGKFPQYYAAYFELVSAGVKFPQAPHVPANLSSQTPKDNLPENKPVSPKRKGVAPKSESQNLPESSIIQKASTALDVLREVLDDIDIRNPEGAKAEFTLDLVEQCSFQKQRVMHLVLTCRNENVVSQAIELNEQLEKVLARHDAIILARATSTANLFHHEIEEEEEEEEADQLLRRIRKGKACMRPEDEDHHKEKPLGGLIQKERLLHRPLIRPTSLEEEESSSESTPPAAAIIPPPPAKRIERERFFQEKQVVNGTGLAGNSESNGGNSTTGLTVDST